MGLLIDAEVYVVPACTKAQIARWTKTVEHIEKQNFDSFTSQLAIEASLGDEYPLYTAYTLQQALAGSNEYTATGTATPSAFRRALLSIDYASDASINAFGDFHSGPHTLPIPLGTLYSTPHRLLPSALLLHPNPSSTSPALDARARAPATLLGLYVSSRSALQQTVAPAPLEVFHQLGAVESRMEVSVGEAWRMSRYVLVRNVEDGSIWLLHRNLTQSHSSTSAGPFPSSASAAPTAGRDEVLYAKIAGHWDELGRGATMGLSRVRRVGDLGSMLVVRVVRTAEGALRRQNDFRGEVGG